MLSCNLKILYFYFEVKISQFEMERYLVDKIAQGNGELNLDFVFGWDQCQYKSNSDKQITIIMVCFNFHSNSLSYNFFKIKKIRFIENKSESYNSTNLI